MGMFGRQNKVQFFRPPFLDGAPNPMAFLKAAASGAQDFFTPQVMMLAPTQPGYGAPSQPIAAPVAGQGLASAAAPLPMGPAAMASAPQTEQAPGYSDIGVQHGLEPMTAPAMTQAAAEAQRKRMAMLQAIFGRG